MHVVPGHHRVVLTCLKWVLPTTTTLHTDFSMCERVKKKQWLAVVPSPHYFHLLPLLQNLQYSVAISNSQNNQ